MRWIGTTTVLLGLLLTGCPDPPVSPDAGTEDINAETDAGGDGDVSGELGDTDATPDTDAQTEVDVIADPGGDDTDSGDAEVTDADVPDGDGGDGDGGGELGDADGADGSETTDIQTDGGLGWPPANATCAEDSDCLQYITDSDQGFDAECMAYSCDLNVCVFDETVLDNAVCADADLCVQQATCGGGHCVVQEWTCDDGDACTVDVCDAGACSTSPIADGDPCDDGIKCTEEDVCDAAGTCAGEPTIDCPCQQDTDCDNLALDACTGAWICEAYDCVADPANAVICDTSGDGPCEDTLCNPANAQCEKMDKSNGTLCDTGDPCVAGDEICVDKVCTGLALVCNDGEDCTTELCDSDEGGCVFTDLEGVACDDDNPCTEIDLCSSGKCAVAQLLNCDDNNECTTDQCEPGEEGGCVYGNLTDIACEDGDACTVGDTCQGGSCTTGPTTIVCNDNEDCTDDSCDTSDGECIFAANTNSCDDGDACTSGDVCAGGSCTGTPPDCDDDNACTIDSCEDQDGSAVCLNQPLGQVACDDGEPCTSADFCFDGACVGGDPDPLCAGCDVNSDCTTFDPANMCVGTYVCNQTTKQCEADPGTVVTCSVVETTCTENQCDPVDGQCKMLPKTANTACDDADPCTEGDGCSPLGVCGGTPKDCDDGEDCTADQCDAGGTCQHTTVSGTSTTYDVDFNSGLPNGWSTTSDNSDVAWAATSAEDAGSGGMAMRVTGTNLTYDYGTAEAHLTLPPASLQGNSVTISFSVKADFAEETGEFNKCFSTGDYVQVRLYTSPTSYVPVWCLSNDTTGWVDVVAKLPTYSTDVTIAFVFHSNDANNNATGVVIDNVKVVSAYTCSTGTACIPGLCSAGTCMALPQDCDDDDPCTTDDCNTTTGDCEFTPIANCECTADEDCGFSFNPCIAMVCDTGQCKEQELSGTCDDDNDCTTNDACAEGVCTGPPRDCGDADECTLDSCNPFLAPADVCIHTPATLACDDGDSCTNNDVCSLSGTCGGTLIDCSSQGCIDSACNSGTGLCEFVDLKSEGSEVWKHTFEVGDIPGGQPEGWDIDPGAFIWQVGGTQSKSAPFSLEVVGPLSSNAGTTKIILPPIAMPADGGYLTYWLYLSRSPAYQASVDISNDVMTVIIDGNAVALENTHNPAWAEQTIELSAATYGGKNIVIEFEWRNGADSVALVVIDSLFIGAHAPCDDGDVCTSDDECSLGTCGGTSIPGCP